MRRFFAAFVTVVSLASPAWAGQPAGKPILALWEYGDWTAATAERPLGLRFVLLEGGQAIFSPDDPAADRLIPAGFFQAQLSAEEVEDFIGRIDSILLSSVGEAQLPTREGDWTAFYFRDPESGAPKRAEVAGHPCLARFRVFSATAPVEGLAANRNSDDRDALSPALREVCNLLTGFHHAGAKAWNPAEVPAPLPAP